MAYHRLPPRSAFPHSIVYREKIGEDDYQKPTFAGDITVDTVWFNFSTAFSRSGNNSIEKAPNASITMLYRYCGELPKFKNDSTVIFDGQEFNIIKSKPLLLNGEAMGWRLEVV